MSGAFAPAPVTKSTQALAKAQGYYIMAVSYLEAETGDRPRGRGMDVASDGCGLMCPDCDFTEAPFLLWLEQSVITEREEGRGTRGQQANM